MNQKFTLEEIFPTWYRSVESTITAELVANRISAIKKILEITKIEFWLDIVRAALGIKVQNSTHINTFVKTFQTIDVNFPVTSNDNLVKVLAQITLCALFDKKNDTSFIVGNAISVANFFESYAISEIPFCSKAIDNISSFKEETFDITPYTDELSETGENIEEDLESLSITNNDVVNLIEVNKFLLKESLEIKQELNILWWLFGEFSSTFNDYFTNVGIPRMIVASALEINDLNESKYALISSKHILVKALLLSHSHGAVMNDVDIPSIINVIPKETIELLADKSSCEELTPILLAFNLAKEFGEKKWQGPYLKKLKLKKLDKKYKPGLLAYQLFCELRLVKFLND